MKKELKVSVEEFQDGEGWIIHYLTVKHDKKEVLTFNFCVGQYGLKKWLPKLLHQVYKLGQNNPNKP